jgi:hypothetical protein
VKKRIEMKNIIQLEMTGILVRIISSRAFGAKVGKIRELLSISHIPLFPEADGLLPDNNAFLALLVLPVSDN